MTQTGKTVQTVGFVIETDDVETIVAVNGQTLPANRKVLCIMSNTGALTGLVMDDAPRDFQRLTIINKSADSVSFDAVPATANFVYLGLNKTILSKGIITMIYDGTDKIWRYVSGEMVI